MGDYTRGVGDLILLRLSHLYNKSALPTFLAFGRDGVLALEAYTVFLWPMLGGVLGGEIEFLWV
jgi:hypothetical protein